MTRRTGAEVMRHRPNQESAANSAASTRKGAISGQSCSHTSAARARRTVRAMRVSTVFSKSSPPGRRFAAELVMRLRQKPPTPAKA